MTPASYSVVRYIADPGRGEAFNIGIILWGEGQFRIRVDDDALARVTRQNAHLAKDALSYVEPFLYQELSNSGSFDEEAIDRFVSKPRGLHLTLTEARYTTLSERSEAAFQATLDRLVARVVKPVRLPGGGGATPFMLVRRRLSPLIRTGLVKEGHPFEASRTGLPRTAEFFVNSNANIALDTLKLSVQRADEILARADAEAFKVEDVLSENTVRYVVYCELSNEGLLRDATENALKVLKSVGAQPETELEDATGPLERAALSRS